MVLHCCSCLYEVLAIAMPALALNKPETPNAMQFLLLMLGSKTRKGDNISKH